MSPDDGSPEEGYPGPETGGDGPPNADADETASTGYDTDYDPTADPHTPDLGGDAERLEYRRLPQALTSADSVSDLLETIRLYGWIPPFLGLLIHGLARGVLEFFSEPFAISHGYVFEGWPIAFAINLVFGVFVGGFTWFLYFGVISAFAGFFSDTKVMETELFKVGGYLLVLFVPLLAVSAAIATTIPPSVAAVTGEGAPAIADVHRAVGTTPQMRVVGVLLGLGWVVVGFLLIPVVGELFDVDRKASVISVLPVTLVAVVATQLV